MRFPCATHLVILFRSEKEAERGMKLVQCKMREMGLRLNEKKTKIVETKDGREGFEFLGFHNHRVRSPKYRKLYLQKWPGQKAMNRLRFKVREVLGRSTLTWDIEEIGKALNSILRGWMNYFKYGNSSKKFSQVDSYIRERLSLWWSKKHGRSGRRWSIGFGYKGYKACGIQILTGNVVYWSRRSNAQG